MDRFVQSDRPSSSQDDQQKQPKKRKYNDNYIKYCFMVLGNKPQCVVCSEVLSAESMKPSKMIRHLETKHPTLKNKPVDFFERKISVLDCQKSVVSQLSGGNVSQNSLLASYQVALRVAKKGKLHTIAEELILPAAQDMVSTMVGPEAANKLSSIPLSNNSVGRRISEMADDVKGQLKEKLKKSEYFSIQFDESTDVANLAQFICFICYESDGCVEEDILFCQPLPKHATGEAMYKVFVDATSSFEIDWKKCIMICSDGAKALTGKNSGLVAQLKSLMPNAEWTHCFLHRQALASKTMPKELKEVLDIVIKSVNFVKSKPLQCRLFSKLCEALGAEYTGLLLHTEARWLSRGKVLSRVWEMRSELQIFLANASFSLEDIFRNDAWLLKLAYLADIFQHINDLNTSLQGRDKTIIFSQDKVNAFVKKLDAWTSRVKIGNFENFELTHGFITDLQALAEDLEEVPLLVNDLSQLAVEHLQGLQQQIAHYIPEKDFAGSRWVLSPFSEQPVNQADLGPQLHDKLIELSCDKTLQLSFVEKEVDKFWLDRRNEYPGLTSSALKILITFATSYLCELGFSTLLNVKTKARNRLNVEDDLLVCITKIQPNLQQLVKTKQAQVSH